jgi:hypothetical protein
MVDFFFICDIYYQIQKIMNVNRFKQLLESTMGNVRPLISEQETPGTTQPVAAGGGGAVEPKAPKVGGYGVDLTAAKNVETYKTKYKTSLPTKVDEENIQFTRQFYKDGKYVATISYKYNCAKQDPTLVPTIKPGSQYERYWMENGRWKRGDDQGEVCKMLTAFCASALPDGPYYRDNKLYYTCKDGSGAISTAPC